MKNYLILFSLLLVTQLAIAQSNKIEQPIKNFESLWQTFNQRYANFDYKGIDWDEIYKKYRPKVTAKTSNQELFDICCAMLQELRDGHVTIETNYDGQDVFCGLPYEFSYYQEFPNSEDDKALKKVMEQTLAQHGVAELKTYSYIKDSPITYGSSQQYGYLRVSDMAETPTFGRIKRAMNTILEDLETKNGLIIDLRLNGGGWDKTSYKIAGRFVRKKQVGHYKKTRKKGTDQFSNLKKCYLKPKGKYQFTKPIVILTSDFTASAAEVFILALQQLPYVTIVGDNTAGIFSDMFPFKLSNGWRVSLSHQQYFSAYMKNYEGKGFTPAYKVSNTKADLTNGFDPVIKKAIEVLDKKKDEKL